MIRRVRAYFAANWIDILGLVVMMAAVEIATVNERWLDRWQGWLAWVLLLLARELFGLHAHRKAYATVNEILDDIEDEREWNEAWQPATDERRS